MSWAVFVVVQVGSTLQSPLMIHNKKVMPFSDNKAVLCNSTVPTDSGTFTFTFISTLVDANLHILLQ